MSVCGNVSMFVWRESGEHYLMLTLSLHLCGVCVCVWYMCMCLWYMCVCVYGICACVWCVCA